MPVLAYWFIPVPKAAGAVDVGLVREHAEAAERRGLWQRAYLPALAGALRRPVVTLLVALVVFGGTMAMVPFMETNLIGGMEQNSLTVTEKFLPGTSLDAQDAAAREVEEVLVDVPQVLSVQTTVGSGDMMAMVMGASGSSASFTVTLDPDANVKDAQVAVRSAVADLGGDRVTGIKVTTGEEAYLTSTVDLVVTAADVDVLAEAAAQVAEAVQDADGVLSVENGLAANQEIIDITVDREAAAALGLTETAVSQTVAGLMYGAPLGVVDLGEGPVSVNLAPGSAPANPEELANAPLMGSDGPLVLGQVASVEQVEVPSAITRVDGERSGTVSVTPAGQDVGGLTTELEDVVDALELPAGATVVVGGIASEMADAFSDLSLALAPRHHDRLRRDGGDVPQPGAAADPAGVRARSPRPVRWWLLAGHRHAARRAGDDRPADARRHRGDERDRADRPDQPVPGQGTALQEAIVEGGAQAAAADRDDRCGDHLRPAADGVGVTGGGGFISQPLAVVVIGGLITSTLLTLIVVPVLYTLSARPSERRRIAALVAETERAAAPA